MNWGIEGLGDCRVAGGAIAGGGIAERACTAAFLEVCADLLARGNRVRFRAEGWSMHPTIRHGELITVATVSACDIGPGDILLCHVGRTIFAHRLVCMTQVEDKLRLTLRGDGTCGCDGPITPQQVLGRVTAVDRDGRCVTLAGRRARLRWRITAIARLQDCRIAGLRIARIAGIAKSTNGWTAGLRRRLTPLLRSAPRPSLKA